MESLIQGVVVAVPVVDSQTPFSTPRGATPLCDLNGDVRLDRVWFSGYFVLNGVSISSLSVFNRVSLHELMA